MRYFLVVALLLATPMQNPGPAVTGALAAAAGCTAPTAYETNEWPVFGSITCTGGCSTGNAITLVPDIVGSTNLTAAGGGNDPTFVSSAFGTLGAANFSSTVPQYFPFSSTFSLASTYSWWFTFQSTTNGTGQALTANTLGAFEYRINSSRHQEILIEAVASLGAGTATFASATKYTVGMTRNSSTGAWTLYTFSGGASTVDASGTTAGTFTQPQKYVGLAGGGEGFDGRILDGGYFAGSWTSTALTAIAAYSLCKAGV
jgi:hypothetical protein